MWRADWTGLVLAAALAGCSQPSQPPDTGARAAAQGFIEALRRRDWSDAYGRLHAESQTRYSQEQFQRRAEQYHRDLGFEPQTAHVVSCEEHAEEVLTHIVLIGRIRGRQRRYKDLVVLRPGEKGWGVVLLPHFGQGRKAGSQ